jgi:hypothetical protein
VNLVLATLYQWRIHVDHLHRLSVDKEHKLAWSNSGETEHALISTNHGVVGSTIEAGVAATRDDLWEFGMSG